MIFLDHIWLIPLLPALGAATMLFFGRKLQKTTINAVCVGAVVLAFVFSCGAVWQYTDYAHANPGKPYQNIVYTWLGTGNGDTSVAPAQPGAEGPQITFLTRDGRPVPFQADAGFLLDPL